MSGLEANTDAVRVAALLGAVGLSQKGAVTIGLKTNRGAYAFAVNLQACNALRKPIERAEQIDAQGAQRCHRRIPPHRARPARRCGAVR